MRILHVIETLDFGGAEKIVVALANSLARDHDVTVCCLKRTGVLATELDPRIDVVCFDKKEGNDYLLPWRLERFIRTRSYDVVHTHNWAVFLDGGIGGARARAPFLIHTAHGPYPDYPPTLLGRSKKGLRRLLERRLARRFGAIVTVSHAIADYVTRDVGIPRSHVHVIHNGIPEAATAGTGRATDAQAAVTFITVGRLAAIKNHRLMLLAFARLLRSRPDARLVVVGDGPERPALEALARETGAEGRVELLGFRTDIDGLLARADVFLLTSHYEGISMALLEAMRAGLPAIGTSVGGIPETIVDGRTGILVPPDDADSLTAAMSALANDATRRQKMGEEARAYLLREFSHSVMMQKYLTLYEGSRERSAA